MTADPTRSDGEMLSGTDNVSHVVRLARDHLELFHDPDKVAYARVKVGHHWEVYLIASEDFIFWLEALVLSKNQQVLSAAQMSAACTTLSALARHAKKTRSVSLRVATRQGKYYIDMGDKHWRVIEIDDKGWRVLTQSPVMFRRVKGMRPLPIPAKGGKFLPILKLTNLPREEWIFILAWMIECFRPDTPYVGLQICGEAGVAKSSTQNVLCSLIDPFKRNLRVKPKSRDDIFALANNAHLLSYENLSVLSSEMQDALCPILTGGAEAAGRRLHTNAEIATVDIQKPVVLNGVNSVVTAVDLMDRFISVELQAITNGRITQADLDRRRKAESAKIFGAILNRFSKALANLPAAKADPGGQLPRMADFALLGEAVARSLKRPPGWFITKFNAKRGVAADAAIGQTDFGTAICAFIAAQPGGISGTFPEIDAALQRHRPSVASPGAWPKSGKGFGDILRRLTPALRLMGISVDRHVGHARATIWTLRTAPAM